MTRETRERQPVFGSSYVRRLPRGKIIQVDTRGTAVRTFWRDKLFLFDIVVVEKELLCSDLITEY